MEARCTRINLSTMALLLAVITLSVTTASAAAHNAIRRHRRHDDSSPPIPSGDKALARKDMLDAGRARRRAAHEARIKQRQALLDSGTLRANKVTSTDTPIRTCSDLAAKIDAISIAAESMSSGYHVQTIKLACGADFSDCDAVIALDGRAKITITADSACLTGDKRPKLSGAALVDDKGVLQPIFDVYGFDDSADYEYDPPPSITAFALSGVVIDCQGVRAGLYFTYMIKVTLTNVDVINCVSDMGGGIYAEDSPLTVTNGKISGNSAPVGGGIYSYTESMGVSLVFTNTIIQDNEANDGPGGAFYFEKYTDEAVALKCTSCKIINNAASDNCSVLMLERYDLGYNYNTGNDVIGKPMTITLTKTTISGNSSPDRSALCGAAYDDPWVHSKITPKALPGLTFVGPLGEANDFLWMSA